MSDKRDQSTLAAEYALGLLDGDALRQARERADSDPAFSSEVARWRGRLAPLHEEFEEVAPPAGLWSRIDRGMSGRGAANDNAAMLRRRLGMWRSATAAMTAIAASLALLLLVEPRTMTVPQPQVQQRASTPMVAMLGNQGTMKVVASWDPAARQLVLAVPGDMPADPVHSHELWVIPAGGKPRSLGTMAAGKQMHMQLADALADLLQQGATIAISVEPRGGSPTGAPTGPVVASGALTRA
jgi:anti-sigma-K factor RskA